MKREIEIGILTRVGVSIAPDSESVLDGSSNGWTVTVPGIGGWTVHYADFAEVRNWLYSWGASELPEYLALKRFREILDGASSSLIDELCEWLRCDVMGSQVKQIRAEIYRIALDQDTDLSTLSDSIEDVIRQKIWEKHLSLGQRMRKILEAHLAAA